MNLDEPEMEDGDPGSALIEEIVRGRIVGVFDLVEVYYGKGARDEAVKYATEYINSLSAHVNSSNQTTTRSKVEK